MSINISININISPASTDWKESFDCDNCSTTIIIDRASLKEYIASKARRKEEEDRNHPSSQIESTLSSTTTTNNWEETSRNGHHRIRQPWPIQHFLQHYSLTVPTINSISISLFDNTTSLAFNIETQMNEWSKYHYEWIVMISYDIKKRITISIIIIQQF